MASNIRRVSPGCQSRFLPLECDKRNVGIPINPIAVNSIRTLGHIMTLFDAQKETTMSSQCAVIVSTWRQARMFVQDACSGNL